MMRLHVDTHAGLSGFSRLMEWPRFVLKRPAAAVLFNKIISSILTILGSSLPEQTCCCASLFCCSLSLLPACRSAPPRRGNSNHPSVLKTTKPVLRKPIPTAPRIPSTCTQREPTASTHEFQSLKKHIQRGNTGWPLHTAYKIIPENRCR